MRWRIAGLGGVLLIAALVGVQRPVMAAGFAADPQRAPPTEARGETSTEPLDLNTAAAEQLRALPGMGETYARRIVEGRPYTAKNQLVTRGVLPAGAYQAIRDHVVARRLSGTPSVDAVKAGP